MYTVTVMTCKQTKNASDAWDLFCHNVHLLKSFKIILRRHKMFSCFSSVVYFTLLFVSAESCVAVIDGKYFIV